MCVSGTHTHGHGAANVDHAGISRRQFLAGTGVAAVGALAATVATARPARASSGSTVVDLTHRLVKDFPDFYGTDAAASSVVTNSFDTSGFYGLEWTINEHIGTHIDAPGHFGQGSMLADEIPADMLVAPLAVIDIKRKANRDVNAVVTIRDIRAYEKQHGEIPEGSLVAMNSGWADLVADQDAFRGGLGFPDLNFPGFSGDAADWLAANRNVVGLATDTMSLDPGNSPDFAVHFGFLPTNRYGIESIANLDGVPAAGATVIVGVIPWEDGSGGPCRVLALV